MPLPQPLRGERIIRAPILLILRPLRHTAAQGVRLSNNHADRLQLPRVRLRTGERNLLLWRLGSRARRPSNLQEQEVVVVFEPLPPPDQSFPNSRTRSRPPLRLRRRRKQEEEEARENGSSS